MYTWAAIRSSVNSITTPNDQPASRGEQTAQTVKYQVGDTYERNRFEVHTQSESGMWLNFTRQPKTLEEAREAIRKGKEANGALRGFIDVGRWPRTRIVEVKATVTVIEII